MTDAAVQAVQTWMTADLWYAMRLPRDELPGYFQRNGFATTWATLLAKLREDPRCGRWIDATEVCVLAAGHGGPHYGQSDVGRCEPLPVAK